LKAIEISFQGVEHLAEDFEERLFDLAGRTVELGQEHPAVLVKVLQVIEREEKKDQLLKKKLEEKGLDPYLYNTTGNS
jgi:hypothetical protein